MCLESTPFTNLNAGLVFGFKLVLFVLLTDVCVHLVKYALDTIQPREISMTIGFYFVIKQTHQGNKSIYEYNFSMNISRIVLQFKE